MSLLLALFVFLAAAYVLGFIRGAAVGVKETERRWSDAVKRTGHQ